MAENLVKFVYGTAADFANTTKDANTIYFIKDGDLYKIYKGNVLYDGTSPSVAADLATLESYIGTLPVEGNYTDLIDYIEKSDAAVASDAQDAIDALDSALAAVAKSGAAADVSIADAGNLITAANVEGALQELATAIATNDAAAEVTIESASGSGDVLTTYDFYQGVLGTDDAAAKAAKKIGTINIPKDYLVRSATIETVDTVDKPYAGAAVGDKYIDFVVNTKDGDTGTPAHMYIALNDLVAVMQGSVGSEITVAIGANNTIQATVNEISGDKIIYAVGTGGAEDVTVNDKIAELEEALGDGLAALDADVDADMTGLAGADDTEAVAVVTGVTEVDGIITGVDSAAADKAGAASRAKAAVIGQSTDLASADTIYGAKQFATDAINALDADLDATTDNTDRFKVAVVTGVTEANGVITGVDSVAADAAGAATTVKSEVIGASTDTKTADTVNGAKAYAKDYADTLLTWGSLSNS